MAVEQRVRETTVRVGRAILGLFGAPARVIRIS